MPSRVVLLALALQCQAVDWHNSTSATERDPIARLLAVAGDATQSSEARLESLLELQEKVEDVDDARRMDFDVAIECLAEPRLRSAAAWVVGTAAANQRELQLRALGALAPLMDVVGGDADDAARAKALFAASALLRCCPEAQWRLYSERSHAEAVLSALAGPPKVARKALVLAADLLHEFLAARRAEASGRTEYDGLKHDARPPSPLWPNATQEAGPRLCYAASAALEGSFADKALQALKIALAAGFLDGDAAGCRRTHIPPALDRLRRDCADDDDACADALVLADELRRDLASGKRPEGTWVATDSHFHLEL